jgi:hypothetical protein
MRLDGLEQSVRFAQGDRTGSSRSPARRRRGSIRMSPAAGVSLHLAQCPSSVSCVPHETCLNTRLFGRRCRSPHASRACTAGQRSRPADVSP